MAWGNQGRTHYVYGAGSWSQYYWSLSYNPNADFENCLANCTTYAYGRVKENGLPAPVTVIKDANKWHTVYNRNADWDCITYTTGMQLKKGDILQWGDRIKYDNGEQPSYKYSANHVAVVEEDGTSPFVSGSWYTGDDGTANSNRTAAVIGGTSLQAVSDWMNATSGRQFRFYHFQLMSDESSMAGHGYEPMYVLRYTGSTPTPPTPSATPVIVVNPSSATGTITSDEDYIDFTFDVTIYGIPYGESAQGGNTYPDLSRVYNTGWSYTTYSYQGVIYQTARKTQTLRYERESANAYTTTKHMYYNLTFSNGSITSDTPMVINVLATGSTDPDVSILAYFIRKRKRHIQVLKRKIATK